MQTPKVSGNSSEPPLKVSPRAARQLKPALDTNSPNSSKQKSRSPKERNAAVVERLYRRGSVTELPKRSPSKVLQLESQIAELHLDLSKAKEQLRSSETLKQQALREAEESPKQVSALTQELEDSKKFQELSMLEEARSVEFQKICEREKEWQSKYEALQIHHMADFAALGSAMDEIQRLKSQLEITKNSAVEVTETCNLEEKLEETYSLIEDMKTQMKECKDSEANAHALAKETLIQLETARIALETLRSEGTKSTEAYNNLALELEESKTSIKLLEEHVCKLKTDLSGTVQLNNTSELVEHVKSESTRRETDIEVNCETLQSYAAELKAELINKETELQRIIEENIALNCKIKDASSSRKEVELEKELKELKGIIMDLKANLMDKETEFQNILEENETLKSELRKKEMDIGRANDSTATELNAAKAAEKEAVAKLAFLKEETDRSSKRATRMAEQLAATQAANAEMEAELRKIKVQCDQWRKAAEVAASMLNDASPGSFNGRNGSLEGKCSPLDNRTTSFPYNEYPDEDSFRKKNGNGNVLKKFGLSWKKSQK